MGIWQGTNTTGNVGGTNVRLSPQTHVQVTTSAESFAAQYEFFNSEAPRTTLVVPEPPGRVEISGRAVEFPQNRRRGRGERGGVGDRRADGRRERTANHSRR